MSNYKSNLRVNYVVFVSVVFFLLAQPFRFFRLYFGVEVSGYVVVLVVYLVLFLIFVIIYGFENFYSVISKLLLLFVLFCFVLLNGSDLKYLFILIGAVALYIAQTTFLERAHASEKVFLAIFRSLGIYSLIVFFLVLATIAVSSGFGNVIQALIDPVTYLHRQDSNLYLLYNHIRFESVFLDKGPREYVYDGVQLALYPYFYCLLYVVAPKQSRDIWTFIFMLLAVFVVLCFNSRTMILSLIYLYIYANFIEKYKILLFLNKLILLIIVFFPVGVYFLLSDELLRGRGKVYDLVVVNGINAFGHGAGKANQHLADLTGFLGSFHNIHLELVYNFGYVVYAVGLIFVIKKISCGVNKYYVAFIVFVFFYMSTNGNLVDYYFVYISVLLLHMSTYFERFELRNQ
ncbi:MAG: hypothetical protein V7749_14395 [Cocleimonas sp.]